MSETNQAERQAIRIRPMMQFSTYQVRLAAYPKDASVPVHDCWKRAILRVISYLEYKLRDAGKDTELYKNILSYGTPEDYANFDPDTVEVGRFHIPMKLKTYYDKEQKTWTVFYNEPDGGLKHVPYPDGTYHDEAPVPDRSFLMDVSIMEEEECVAIAIRCICRDQEESIRTVRVIRPHFVKEMINDPMMLVTEYGVPARFAFNFGSMSPVNTKNASDS